MPMRYRLIIADAGIGARTSRISRQLIYYQRQREAMDDETCHRRTLDDLPVNMIASLAALLERANDRCMLICKWLIIMIVATLAIIRYGETAKDASSAILSE